jgi:hypothetical protein
MNQILQGLQKKTVNELPRGNGDPEILADDTFSKDQAGRILKRILRQTIQVL